MPAEEKKRDNLSMEDNLKISFSRIKAEIQDHLLAINENTGEINANFEYLQELEMKIDKLNEKVEELALSVKGKAPESLHKEIVLTMREQEIFLLLYARNGDLIDYKEVAKSLGLTEDIVSRNIESVICKGIPVIKRHLDNRVYLVIDPEFRNLQAKGEIVKISDTIKKAMHYKKII